MNQQLTSDEKWAIVRNEEEVKVDWHDAARELFITYQNKKSLKVEYNFEKFFDKDIKKAKKNMKKYVQSFKFNFKILYNDGKSSCIIPASKVDYFEHALSATYYPK